MKHKTNSLWYKIVAATLGFLILLIIIVIIIMEFRKKLIEKPTELESKSDKTEIDYFQQTIDECKV